MVAHASEWTVGFIDWLDVIMVIHLKFIECFLLGIVTHPDCCLRPQMIGLLPLWCRNRIFGILNALRNTGVSHRE
jgi:hypothetical protein